MMINQGIYFAFGICFSAIIAVIFYLIINRDRKKHQEKEDKMINILAKALEKIEK
jgi:preprotein translocase subunit YajC